VLFKIGKKLILFAGKVQLDLFKLLKEGFEIFEVLHDIDRFQFTDNAADQKVLFQIGTYGMPVWVLPLKRRSVVVQKFTHMMITLNSFAKYIGMEEKFC
jgi:hypothetical protein